MLKDRSEIRLDSKFAAVSRIEAKLLEYRSNKEPINLKTVKPICTSGKAHSRKLHGEGFELVMRMSDRYPDILVILVTVTHPEFEGEEAISSFQFELMLEPIGTDKFLIKEINGETYATGTDEESVMIRHRFIRLLRGMWCGIHLILNDPSVL